MPKPDKQIKKSIKRTKISDSQLKSEIMSLFNAGKSGKTDLFGFIRTQFTLGRDRYFKMYDSVYSEWSVLKQKAESEGMVEATKEAIKTGLKSKLEKQLHIQKAIDDMQADIDSLDVPVTDGEIASEKDGMKTIELKAYLRKTIRELYAELNKMEGDYAASNVKISNPDGEEFKVHTTHEVIFRRFSDKEHNDNQPDF